MFTDNAIKAWGKYLQAGVYKRLIGRCVASGDVEQIANTIVYWCRKTAQDGLYNDILENVLAYIFQTQGEKFSL